jgi:hypothetical protein
MLCPSQISDKYSDFYARLKAKGKHPKKCMVALSRKLAIKAYYDMKKCQKSA